MLSDGATKGIRASEAALAVVQSAQCRSSAWRGCHLQYRRRHNCYSIGQTATRDCVTPLLTEGNHQDYNDMVLLPTGRSTGVAKSEPSHRTEVKDYGEVHEKRERFVSADRCDRRYGYGRTASPSLYMLQ